MSEGGGNPQEDLDDPEPEYEDPLEDECDIGPINYKIGKTLWFVIAVLAILVVISLLTYITLELEEKSNTMIYMLGIFSGIGVIYVLYASRQNKRISLCETAGY